MASSKPRVSVLTIAYNHERFVGDCIRSVLAQTYADWEQVVLDDGSTDRTVEVARAIRDPRVRVLTQKHAGLARLAETYNRALAECRGELIAILEGDDLFRRRKLERQVPDFDDPNLVLSASRFLMIDADGKPLTVTHPKPPAVEFAENRPTGMAACGMLRHDLLTFAFPVTLLIKRSALEKIGGFQQEEPLPLVDYPTLLNLGLVGGWRFHNRAFALWRRHGSSTTSSRLPSIIEGAYRCAAKFLADHRAELPMTPKEIAMLDARWRDFQSSRCEIAARALWLQGRWHEARAFLARGRLLSPKWRRRVLLALAGALCVARRCPEALFRFAGKPPLPECAYVSNDLIVDLDAPPEAIGVYSFLAAQASDGIPAAAFPSPESGG